MEEIKSYIQNNAKLIDVRTPEEFAEGSVKGSLNYPLDKIEFYFSVLKKDEPIVVFCRSGNRSGQAKRILEKAGYNKIINGGAWITVKEIIKSL